MCMLPLTVPGAEAANDTTAWTDALAASSVFGAGALTVSTPVIVTPWIVALAAPMFVIVIVCCTGSPTRVVGSTAGLGATSSDELIPLHVSGIEIVGFVGSLLEIVIVPGF